MMKSTNKTRRPKRNPARERIRYETSTERLSALRRAILQAQKYDPKISLRNTLDYAVDKLIEEFRQQYGELPSAEVPMSNDLRLRPGRRRGG